MARNFYRLTLSLAVVGAAVAFANGKAGAQVYAAPGYSGTANPEPNYYVAPVDPQGVTAAMYQSPRPTPAYVGETYITYEALAPHEQLYSHHRVYKKCSPDGVMTRTSVTWGHHPTLWPFQPSLRWSVPNLCTPATGPHF